MNRQWLHWVLALFVAFAMVAAPSVAYAQDAEEGETGEPEQEVIGDPAWYPDEVDQDLLEVQPAAADIILAQPPYTMNYQGYLTDGSGSPLNGAYDIVASLWDHISAGTREWGPETHVDAAVSNGLFHLALGSVTPLLPNVFDEALFLELTVGTTTLPRQPLRATAYAYGLVPGATVVGDPDGTSYGLYVSNTGTGASDRGLYARGTQYGIYATGEQYGLYAAESGTGDVGILTPDYVRSGGYRSAADSYLFVPGNAGVASGVLPSAGLQVSYGPNGGAELRNLVAGPVTRYFLIPIQTPAVLFGQNVTIEQVTLYYDLDSAASFITTTNLRKQTGTGMHLASDLLDSTTDLTSTGPTSVSFTPVNAMLDSGTGGLMLRLALRFANTTDNIYIGGVRLRFGHVPPP